MIRCELAWNSRRSDIVSHYARLVASAEDDGGDDDILHWTNALVRRPGDEDGESDSDDSDDGEDDDDGIDGDRDGDGRSRKGRGRVIPFVERAEKELKKANRLLVSSTFRSLLHFRAFCATEVADCVSHCILPHCIALSLYLLLISMRPIEPIDHCVEAAIGSAHGSSSPLPFPLAPLDRLLFAFEFPLQHRNHL